MKKLVISILTIILILTLLISTSFAANGQGQNSSANTSTNSQTNVSGNKEPVQNSGSGMQQGQTPMPKNQVQTKAQFEINKLSEGDLNTQTKASLKNQFQVAFAYKTELQAMKNNYDNMTEEERAAHATNYDELINQIKSAHRYSLQVKNATQEEPLNMFSHVRQNGIPTEDEVESATSIIDEVSE